MVYLYRKTRKIHGVAYYKLVMSHTVLSNGLSWWAITYCLMHAFFMARFGQSTIIKQLRQCVESSPLHQRIFRLFSKSFTEIYPKVRETGAFELKLTTKHFPKHGRLKSSHCLNLTSLVFSKKTRFLSGLNLTRME